LAVFRPLELVSTIRTNPAEGVFFETKLIRSSGWGLSVES
jgi:hypothetical protein